MTRVVNASGLTLVKHFENCVLTAYQDNNGIFTIGYGHTGPDVREGLTWTQVLADQWLECDLQDAAAIVEKSVAAGMTDNQFAALASFVYNVGPGNPAKGKSGFLRLANGKPSTLLRLCNIPDFRRAALEFPKWNRDSKGPSKGLTLRRRAEQDLFRA